MNCEQIEADSVIHELKYLIFVIPNSHWPVVKTIKRGVAVKYDAVNINFGHSGKDRLFCFFISRDSDHKLIYDCIQS